MKKALATAVALVGLFVYFERAAGSGAESSTSAPGKSSYRVMILGFDGMDPEFLEYYLSQGKLPNFQRLIREGAYAPLATFKPTKSVVLWTSVATGKRMEKHGIVDWQLLSDGGRKLLASQGSRRTEAIWNMASDGGKSAQVLNWWATWPAEPITGEMVSNHFPRSLHEPIEGATYPAELAAELTELGQPDRADAEREIARVGIPVYSRELALSAFRPSTQFRARFQTVAGVFNDDMITEKSLYHLIETRGQADVVAALFRTTDVYAHILWRFIERRVAEPVYKALREAGEPVTAARSRAMDEAYARVLEPVYVHADRRLGRLMERAGSDTVMMVLSDHRFQFRNYGFNHYDDGRGGVRAPEGVLFLWGPPIRPGVSIQTPTLFDITPTALYLMGLAVGRDMDGRVLEETLAPGLLRNRSIRFVATWDRAVREGTQQESPVDEDVLRELRALDYIQ